MYYKIARFIPDPNNKVQWVFLKEECAFHLRYGGNLLLSINVEDESMIIQDKGSAELPRIIGFDIERGPSLCLEVRKILNGNNGLLVISVESADRIQFSKGASSLFVVDIETGEQNFILREGTGHLKIKKPGVLFVSLTPNSKVIVNQKTVYQFLVTEEGEADFWTQAK